MKKQPAVVFYIKKVFLKISKTSQVNTVLECIIFNKGPGLRSLWKMRLQLIFSCWFCEILKKFSSDRLLLFMKGTKNCLYCKESCMYSKKERLWLTKFAITRTKNWFFSISMIFLKSALRMRLSKSSFMHMSAAVVTWRVKNTFLD